MGEKRYNIRDVFYGYGHNTYIQVQQAADLPVANKDLISLFGNLMNKALEVCEGVENVWVSVMSWLERGYFIISMENPVKQELVEKARMIMKEYTTIRDVMEKPIALESKFIRRCKTDTSGG